MAGKIRAIRINNTPYIVDVSVLTDDYIATPSAIIVGSFSALPALDGDIDYTGCIAFDTTEPAVYLGSGLGLSAVWIKIGGGTNSRYYIGTTEVITANANYNMLHHGLTNDGSLINDGSVVEVD